MTTPRILIVDDDEDLRSLLDFALSREKEWAVSLANNGEDALKKLETQQVDLILLDAMMPVMNGQMTMQALARHDEFSSIPVIVLSATRDDDEMAAMRDLGALATISKPIDVFRLPARIREILASNFSSPPRDCFQSSATPVVTGNVETEELAVGAVLQGQVLVLEDDQEFSNLVRTVLTSSGCEMVCASSIKQAKEKFSEREYVLLIVDGLLPDGLGMDFIAWARAQSTTAPILYLSGVFRDRSTFETLKLDLRVDQVLEKPITPELMAQEINQLLGIGTDGRLTEEVAESLLLQRQAYDEKLPTLLESVQVAVLDARNSSGDQGLLSKAIEVVHRLAGSSGSYGHDRLSQGLVVAEGLLRCFADEPETIRPAHWEILGLSIQQLKSAVDDTAA